MIRTTTYLGKLSKEANHREQWIGSPDHVAVWKAIDAFARNYEHPGSTNQMRMRAVGEVEKALDAIRAHHASDELVEKAAMALIQPGMVWKDAIAAARKVFAAINLQPKRTLITAEHN